MRYTAKVGICYALNSCNFVLLLFDSFASLCTMMLLINLIIRHVEEYPSMILCELDDILNQHKHSSPKLHCGNVNTEVRDLYIHKTDSCADCSNTFIVNGT